MQVNIEPPYSIVLVNYKTLDMTKTCLSLIKKNVDTAKFQVWVVDNGSGDESVAYLRTLDWIKLIERVPEPGENGFTAHGRGLDMALAAINTDYVFLLHSDTFIYDSTILDIMLSKCQKNPNIVVVGCLHQVYRTPLRFAWRATTRYVKHMFRKTKMRLGIQTRAPKEYKEIYLKSFCALWSAKVIKQQGMQFMMGNRVPGYELQDQLTAMHYEIATLPAGLMFKYLDHVEAGTKALRKNFGADNRRVKRGQQMLENLDDKPSD